MGICPSKYHKPYKYFPELVSFRKTFDCLGVTDKEVGKLYKRFKLIDVDDSKSIEVAEILVHLHMEKTFFNKRVFGLLDTDASGELNFEEFMVGLWNYCSVEDEHFEHFAFDLYDIDHSGNIDIVEAQFMVKDIYGEEFEHSVHAKRAYAKLAELDISVIDFPTFSAFSNKHKAMLYPAFALQMNLKKYIMGESFWRRQAQNRLKISGGQYKRVVEIIGKAESHKKRKTYKRDSDFVNMFRRGSKPKLTEQDSFSAPGAAIIPGKYDDILRRGSDASHESRRGSRDHNHPGGPRRGSKVVDDPKLGTDMRRGSKHKVEPAQGHKGHNRNAARRGSRKSDEDRSGLMNIGDPNNGLGKAGARRDSKNVVHLDPLAIEAVPGKENYQHLIVDDVDSSEMNSQTKKQSFTDMRRYSRNAAISPMENGQ